jgi:glucan phosphorylase
VDSLYRRPKDWSRKAILNVANMGRFSSDRSVKEYAEDIWRAPRVLIDMPPPKPGHTAKPQ